ncbi:MAG: hypothetical protein QOF74_7488, partial [Caballeronia mineralivorans]|nr:hypothetical protein [Caballeronia mineralivorans]
EAEVPTHSATNDHCWEAVTVIERFRFRHRAILRDRSRNLTMPVTIVASLINHRMSRQAYSKDAARVRDVSNAEDAVACFHAPAGD